MSTEGERLYMCAGYAELVFELVVLVCFWSCIDNVLNTVCCSFTFELEFLFSNWGTPHTNFLDNNNEVFQYVLHITITNVLLN